MKRNYYAMKWVYGRVAYFIILEIIVGLTLAIKPALSAPDSSATLGAAPTPVSTPLPDNMTVTGKQFNVLKNEITGVRKGVIQVKDKIAVGENAGAGNQTERTSGLPIWIAYGALFLALSGIASAVYLLMSLKWTEEKHRVRIQKIEGNLNLDSQAQTNSSQRKFEAKVEAQVKEVLTSLIKSDTMDNPIRQAIEKLIEEKEKQQKKSPEANPASTRPAHQYEYNVSGNDNPDRDSAAIARLEQQVSRVVHYLGFTNKDPVGGFEASSEQRKFALKDVVESQVDTRLHQALSNINNLDENRVRQIIGEEFQKTGLLYSDKDEFGNPVKKSLSLVVWDMKEALDTLALYKTAQHQLDKNLTRLTEQLTAYSQEVEVTVKRGTNEIRQVIEQQIDEKLQGIHSRIDSLDGSIERQETHLEMSHVQLQNDIERCLISILICQQSLKKDNEERQSAILWAQRYRSLAHHLSDSNLHEEVTRLFDPSTFDPVAVQDAESIMRDLNAIASRIFTQIEGLEQALTTGIELLPMEAWAGRLNMQTNETTKNIETNSVVPSVALEPSVPQSADRSSIFKTTQLEPSSIYSQENGPVLGPAEPTDHPGEILKQFSSKSLQLSQTVNPVARQARELKLQVRDEIKHLHEPLNVVFRASRSSEDSAERAAWGILKKRLFSICQMSDIELIEPVEGASYDETEHYVRGHLEGGNPQAIAEVQSMGLRIEDVTIKSEVILYR